MIQLQPFYTYSYSLSIYPVPWNVYEIKKHQINKRKYGHYVRTSQIFACLYRWILHKQICWKFEWQKRIHIVDSDYILLKTYNRPQIFFVVHFFSCVIDYRLIRIHIPEPSLLHILKIPCEFWPGRSFLLTTTTSTIKETKEWMALGNFFCLLHLRLVWKCQFWCTLGWWTKHFSWQACNPL